MRVSWPSRRPILAHRRVMRKKNGAPWTEHSTSLSVDLYDRPLTAASEILMSVIAPTPSELPHSGKPAQPAHGHDESHGKPAGMASVVARNRRRGHSTLRYSSPTQFLAS